MIWSKQDKYHIVKAYFPPIGSMHAGLYRTHGDAGGAAASCQLPAHNKPIIVEENEMESENDKSVRLSKIIVYRYSTFQS